MMNKVLFTCCFFISHFLLSCQWGKWLEGRVFIPLIEGNKEKEIKVQERLSGNHNSLCDKDDFYVNNFFPYNEKELNIVKDTKQLSDIFNELGISVLLDGQKEIINEDDLARLKNPNAATDDNRDLYVKSFVKFLEAVKIYLNVFNASSEYIDQIIRKSNQKEGPDEKLLCIMTMLEDRNKMLNIWAYMHTERLFLFHKFFDVMANKLKAFSEPVVFVSHYDMCENCEKLMLEKMKDIKSTKIFKRSDASKISHDYKIFVGGFFEHKYQKDGQWKSSRNRNGQTGLLKTRVYIPTERPPVIIPMKK